MSGTPYDDGINQIFQQRQTEQKKLEQPFIIVLRIQLGKYVGCTVNFPPALVNLPDFPPLPPPPAPTEPTNQPPPTPPRRVAIQSIIMIGTNSETKPTPTKLEATNPATTLTNQVMEGNTVSVPEKVSMTQTNAAASGNSGLGSDDAMAVGAAFLVVASGLTLFILRRSRKSGHASIITRSMKKK
jgi:hypothetical protein